MDISMPGIDGLEATRRIRDVRPQARVLMVTGSDAPEDVDAARGAGASGYVTKDRIAAELVVAILDVATQPLPYDRAPVRCSPAGSALDRADRTDPHALRP
jgi:DNA-binding NarL/FixJ family response regulator